MRTIVTTIRSAAARPAIVGALCGVLGLSVGCQSGPETPSGNSGEAREAEVAAQAERIDQASGNPPAEATPGPRGAVDGPEGRQEQSTERTHNARRFYLLGVRYLSEQPPQVEAATREFQYALAEDPLFYKAHFKLGYTYYHRGQYEEEIAEYRKCLAINGRYLPALINLGHALLARDSLAEAREAYLAALDVEPHNAIARYNLGLIEFDLQNYDNSAKHLEMFLSSGQAETASRMGEEARTCLDRIRQYQRSAGGAPR